MPIYDIYAANINGTVVGGKTQGTVDTGTITRGEIADGQLYPRQQSVAGQNPRATFTTLGIAAALNACGPLGAAITAFSAYQHQHAEGGTRTAGSTHRQLLISKGLIIPRRLVCNHQEDAQISYEAFATYDGVNDPIVINESVALPAIAGDDERFSLGNITLGGFALPDGKSLEIDFGIQELIEGGDSDIWPTKSSIAAVVTAITLRGIDPTWFSATKIPLLGAAGTHLNTTIYLRKRADGGTYVIDATPEHIKLTAAGLITVSQPADGESNRPSEASVEMRLNFDGTNAPLVVDTTSVNV